MTTLSITKREIVGAAASAISILVSGCFKMRHRSLSFNGVNVAKPGDEYEASVVVKAGASNIENLDWGTFHDVELVVMTEEEKEIHRESIGDIGGSIGVTETHSFSVRQVPHYLVYDARESTCDEQTRIDKAVRIKHEGEYLWRISEMTCEEEKEFLS